MFYSDNNNDCESGFWITPKRPYLRPQKVFSTSKFCFSGVSKRPEFHEVRPIVEGIVRKAVDSHTSPS